MKKQKVSKNASIGFLLMLSVVLFITLLSPTDAFAYFDPVTGGFLLQIILGVITIIVSIYKFLGKTIKDKFKKIKEDRAKK